MPKTKTRKKESNDFDISLSYLDINQLELAYANRALEDPKKTKMPDFVQLSSKKRVLELQRRNLAEMLKGDNKEYRKGKLEDELKKIISGEKALSISCFLFR